MCAMPSLLLCMMSLRRPSRPDSRLEVLAHCTCKLPAHVHATAICLLCAAPTDCLHPLSFHACTRLKSLMERMPRTAQKDTELQQLHYGRVQEQQSPVRLRVYEHEEDKIIVVGAGSLFWILEASGHPDYDSYTVYTDSSSYPHNPQKPVPLPPPQPQCSAAPGAVSTCSLCAMLCSFQCLHEAEQTAVRRQTLSYFAGLLQ